MHNKEVIFTNLLSAHFKVSTRHAMNVSCNNAMHICNHCCSRWANSKSVC